MNEFVHIKGVDIIKILLLLLFEVFLMFFSFLWLGLECCFDVSVWIYVLLIRLRLLLLLLLDFYRLFVRNRFWNDSIHSGNCILRCEWIFKIKNNFSVNILIFRKIWINLVQKSILLKFLLIELHN